MIKTVSKSLKNLSKQVEKVAKKIENLQSSISTTKADKKKTGGRKAMPKKASTKKVVIKKAAPKKVGRNKSVSKKFATPVKKITLGKKASKRHTVLEKVLKEVSGSKSGISISELKSKTGVEGRQLSNALYKLAKRNMIKAKERGVYVLV